jgi:hypothetical protein
VQALRAIGCSVLDLSKLGKGAPDLAAGFQGRTTLLEIKNPATRYGKAGANANQIEWMQSWRGGPVAVVSDVEGAIRAVRVAT